MVDSGFVTLLVFGDSTLGLLLLVVCTEWIDDLDIGLGYCGIYGLGLSSSDEFSDDDTFSL